MIERLHSLLTTQPAVVYECRQCGRSVDADTDRCPACDTESITSYRVD